MKRFKCGFCHEWFESKAQVAIACKKPECQRKLKQSYNKYLNPRRPKAPEMREKICEVCKKIFLAERGKAFKYCSDECRRIARTKVYKAALMFPSPEPVKREYFRTVTREGVWSGPAYNFCKECVRLEEKYSHDAGQVNEFTPVNDPKRRRVLQDLREIHVHQEQCHGIRRNVEAEAKQLELRGL